MNPGWMPAPYRPLFPEDGNTVFHLWVKRAAVRGTNIGNWSMQGAVPFVGKNGALPEGMGPFSTSNYYSAGDNYEQHGSMTACALVTVANNTTDQAIILKDNGGAARNFFLGSMQGGGASGPYCFVFKSGGNTQFSNNVGRPSNAPHFLAMSYQYVTDGTSIILLAQDSSQQSVSNAVGPPATAAGSNMLLGVQASGSLAWTGYVHEIEYWSRALSGAELTAIYNTLHSKGII